METTAPNEFLSLWINIMMIGSIAFFAIAVIIYLIHQIKVSSISDYKAKYDYLSTKEIKYFKASIICIAIGIGMIINTYGKDVRTFDLVWFFVLIFISIAGATLIGYVGALILQYYYPTRLHSKLKKWRYMPRVNPKTGNKMRLLSEDEEDVHLDEGMQAEEEVFSVDYDVWLDEATGDTKIEKYQGHLEAVQCGNCGFYTMKVEREEIVQQPTAEQEGELIKHYKCQFCSSVRATSFNIAKEEDYSHFKPDQMHFKKNVSVDLVKVEVVALGQKKHYEFQTVEQAEKFLSEFDVDTMK
ncbi:nuclear envelope integral membrane protein [Fulvivirga lutea]|nr:nuclear envelope integral membrane protein [Fulvivirga lutea]